MSDLILEFGKREESRYVWTIPTYLGYKKISRDEAMGKYLMIARLKKEDKITDFSED